MSTRFFHVGHVSTLPSSSLPATLRPSHPLGIHPAFPISANLPAPPGAKAESARQAQRSGPRSCRGEAAAGRAHTFQAPASTSPGAWRYTHQDTVPSRLQNTEGHVSLSVSLHLCLSVCLPLKGILNIVKKVVSARLHAVPGFLVNSLNLLLMLASTFFSDLLQNFLQHRPEKDSRCPLGPVLRLPRGPPIL